MRRKPSYPNQSLRILMDLSLIDPSTGTVVSLSIRRF
jgi:hypothetical protein